jgi:protein-S-isoprenylcysteine O-methyltransferase Ste14
MSSLFARAVVAFLVLPGVVAFLVPYLFVAPAERTSFSLWWATIPLGLGVLLLLACVREFYVAGRGTLAPWSPPEALVVTGLYRWSRNPMYVAVLLVLSGWAIGYRSWPLAVYALAVLVAFHLRIVLHEEPWLARTFGEAWTRYSNQVSRWL